MILSDFFSPSKSDLASKFVHFTNFTIKNDICVNGTVLVGSFRKLNITLVPQLKRWLHNLDILLDRLTV